MPIETEGWKGNVLSSRAMNALAVIALLAENQGYNVWDYEQRKNYHIIIFYRFY